MQFKVRIIIQIKNFILLCWLFPGVLITIFLLSKFTEILDEINLRAVAIIIAVISLFLNAIIFRPEDGSTKPEGPLPKNQIQRLLHAILTAVAIFAILKYTK